MTILSGEIWWNPHPNKSTLWWTNILPWKDPPCLMGKSTISMAIFNSFLYVHQRVKVPSLHHPLLTIFPGVPAHLWRPWTHNGASHWCTVISETGERGRKKGMTRVEPPSEVGYRMVPTSYKLVYKPHEYYSYIISHRIQPRFLGNWTRTRLGAPSSRGNVQ